MTTRRQILRYLGYAGVGAAGIGLSAYSYQRGIRLPTLHWDPLAINTQFSIQGVEQVFGGDLIQTSVSNHHNSAYPKTLAASFRAFSPHPQLSMMCEGSRKIVISIDNIAPQAVLTTNSANFRVNEVVNKTRRTLIVETVSSSQISLQWSFPELSNYSFASIGDTGGDTELHWCIERAHALGAKFLLHLGDFNYQQGDYQRSIDLFNNSPIPIYVSIGNHDFHDNGALYQRFIGNIGPLNNVFSIGKTRFVNIDTAANFLPFGSGQRGKLFDLMAQDNNYTDTVAFTHRPLHDPTTESDHDIGSAGERDWLIQALKKVNVKTLLSGHIHIYDRSNFDGIDNIIVGQGLGHQDLLINGDASKMIIGQIDSNGAVDYRAEPLAMPLELHCHPRVDPVKESLRGGEHDAILQVLKNACSA